MENKNNGKYWQSGIIEKLWCRLASVSGFVIRKNIKGKSSFMCTLLTNL